MNSFSTYIPLLFPLICKKVMITVYNKLILYLMHERLKVHEVKLVKKWAVFELTN
jgi:hypothetical protein